MKILSNNNRFDMAKLIAFTTQKSTKSVNRYDWFTWDMSIKSQYLWDLNWWMNPFRDSHWHISFMKHLIISITWKQVSSIKNTPSFTTIKPYGLFVGLDMTLVITMKHHYFNKYWISDHWHWSQWYRFKTDLISMPNTHDHDRLNTLVTTTFDHMAHFPDLGITSLSQIIGIK